MLDSVVSIETPEGIELHLHPAGPTSRALAWALDALIRAAIYAGVGFSSLWLEELGIGLFLIFAFLMEWFYPVLFEVLREGATPGKKALGLRVVNTDGTPVGWSASILRNLLRVVDFMPAGYGFGLVSMLMTRKYQRLGDLTADTMVIFVDRPSSPRPLTAATPIRSPIALSPEEAQAVIAFSERANAINPERAEELAGLATPLGESGNPPSADRLKAIAHGLIGRQA